MAAIGSRTPLRDIDTRSLATAYAAKLKSEAGRVRWLGEMACGQSLAGGAAVAMTNPDGGIGVNFSGPPFGSAWRHVLWTMGGCKQNESGTVTGQRQVGTITTATSLTVPIRYWHRSFAAGVRVPYSRCYLALRGYATAGAPVTVSVQLDCGANTPSRTATFSLASATDVAVDVTSIYWGIASGGRQAIRAIFTIAAAASSAVITAMAGYQRVKRSH